MKWKHDMRIVMKEVSWGLTCNSSVFKTISVREFSELNRFVYQHSKYGLFL